MQLVLTWHLGLPGMRLVLTWRLVRSSDATSTSPSEEAQTKLGSEMTREKVWCSAFLAMTIRYLVRCVCSHASGAVLAQCDAT